MSKRPTTGTAKAKVAPTTGTAKAKPSPHQAGMNQTAAQAATMQAAAAAGVRDPVEIAFATREGALLSIMMQQASTAKAAIRNLAAMKPSHDASISIGMMRVYVPDDAEATIVMAPTFGTIAGSQSFSPDDLARMAGLLLAAAWTAAAHERSRSLTGANPNCGDASYSNLGGTPF